MLRFSKHERDTWQNLRNGELRDGCEMTDMSRRTLLTGATAVAVTAVMRRVAKAHPGPIGKPHELLDGYDALGLAALVKAKQVNASELLEAAIARTEILNPRYNFMAQKLYDRGRAQIKAGLPHGLFAGVPWLLKDLNIHIAGERTGQGSRFYNDYRATQTSELVKRHEAAGLVIFGKTTTPEFGLTGTTESLAYGLTRNPWNPEYIAGGSSGGSAVAVAAGVLPAAHATDGGGSIRIPASCCGLVGLKPSRGRVPMGPARTEGWGGLSVHHAVTKTVRDSAALLDVTHGLEPGSRYGAPAPSQGFLAQVGKAPGRLRIALAITPPSHAPVDPEVIAATQRVAKLCESLGHRVEEATPPLDAASYGVASFALIASSVAADVLDRATATGITPDDKVLEKMTLAFVEYGKQVTGMDYVRANNSIQAMAVAVAQFMASYDIILQPTVAAPPLKLGQIDLSNKDDFKTWGARAGAWAAYTGFYNGTGQPSMSLPLGMASSGLPIGVMFTGRYAEEALLFRLAAQLERAAPWQGRHPVV
jgi:amidase